MINTKNLNLFGLPMSANYSIEDLTDKINQQYKKLQEQNEKLKAENEKLKDEHYKDMELIKLKKEINDLKETCYRGFPITKDEAKRIAEWRENHMLKRHEDEITDTKIRKQSTFRPIYTFVPTHIGTFGSVYCEDCKAKADKELRDFRVTNKFLEGFNPDWKIREKIKEKKRALYKKYDCECEFQEGV